MDYGQIIKRAAHITWRYKFLWVFGIIMALCGQGSGGNPRFQMNYNLPYDPSSGAPEFPPFFPEPLGQTPIVVYVVAGLVFLVIFGLISIIVGALGRSALIKSVARVEDGEHISFRSSWQDAVAKAVPVGLLQLLLAMPMLALGALVAVIVLTTFWPFFSQIFTYRPTPESQGPPPFVEDFAAFFPMFFATICSTICFFFIIQIIAGLFRTFGSRAIVLESQGVIGSFARSWTLFSKNISATLILALLLFLITIVVGLIVAIPAMAIMFPIMISTMPAMISGSGPSMGNYFLLGAAGIVMVIIVGFIQGIFQVFIESLWTLAYRAFSNETH
ncbi:MAG: hypothetical protein JXM69_05550 [Anaerolineae bacterium]|nr:hypothetical protein [Anaerolineae bacterium]